MNLLSFIFAILCLISIDIVVGILLYILINKNNDTSINSNNFWSDKR